MKMFYSCQIKAARALIKMSQLELAEKTGLHIATIKKIENHQEAIESASMKTIKKITSILEGNGVQFLFGQNNSLKGIGVALKEPPTL